MKPRPIQLNIVVKLTAANGWRREWDMAFRSGVVATVTLAAFSSQNEVASTPAPMVLSAEEFFEQFATVLGAAGAPAAAELSDGLPIQRQPEASISGSEPLS